jgi:hypothetical protein
MRNRQIGPTYWISVADEIIQEDWINLFGGFLALLAQDGIISEVIS